MASMDRRLILDAKLRRILGSENVYFEPPQSLKMKYPCIRYSRSRIDTIHADNKAYLGFNSEDLTFSHDRHYVGDGLHHDVFSTYF